jgi:hypothetical protein
MKTAIEVRVGQVWRVAKDPARLFRVVSVDRDRERAEVVSSDVAGVTVDGRKPYSVTTRSFPRGRYTLVTP